MNNGNNKVMEKTPSTFFCFCFCFLPLPFSLLLLHFLFLITFGMGMGMGAPTTETDRSALLALKSSISNDPLNILSTNWSTSAHLCTWIGVTCGSKNLRVTALAIPNMILEATIPPHLGNLSFLLSLDLSNNSFHGTLPPEFANLRRLTLLDFTQNNLTGPFPISLTALPRLRFLHLSRNRFSGPIPPSIANLTNLEVFRMSQNSLRGAIPSEIGNLRRVTFLDLQGNRASELPIGNRFTGSIPLSIFNLSSLQTLALTRSGLSGELPATICDNLPALEVLTISSNWIGGTIPPNLQKCQKLQVLSLSGNEFTGSIPRELGNLTSLTALMLGANNLAGEIPEEIGNLQKLELFSLVRSNLTGSIPSSIFNISALRVFSCFQSGVSGSLPSTFGLGMPNLEQLYLGRNNLSGFLPDSISNASKLDLLDLAENSFSGPIPESLGRLQFLRSLYLGDNLFSSRLSPNSELTFLTSLANCKNLIELVILGNPLNGKLPASIGNLSTSFKKFVSFGSKIQGSIPEEIGNLSSLTILQLFDNELTGNIPTTLIRSKQLQQLELSTNKITGSIPEVLCSLERLGALDLSENQISGALPACLGNTTSLRNLRLGFNRLSSSLPSSVWNLNNLLQFNVSSNMFIGHLPPGIGNLKSAELIDLSMNNLSGNIPTTIGSLDRLIDFSLANNMFEGPIPDSLSKILSLERLDLSNNNLTGEIPKSFEALIYLRQLNVSFNKLSGEIPDHGPFVNFTYLSFISNEALCGASQFHVTKCPSNSPNRSGNNRVLHIALFISMGVIIALAGLILLRFCKKKKAADQTQFLSQAMPERVSYNELEKATDGFKESNKLGMGGFSSVYKGTLNDGSEVAVKVFNMQVDGAFKSFDTECELLRSLRHRNLTKVITSCTNQDFRALVLDYMPNGSLEKWLYSRDHFLDIMQRLNIMIDVANALNYLHTDYVVPVVHCDLKPSNVLLDKELVGHVSDFGISKILGAEENMAITKTLATIGYIAPEYGLEGLVSTRCDIYSYGILLMETFTRRKPSDEMFAGELNLKNWIKDSVPSDIRRVVDSNLLTQEQKFDVKDMGSCLMSIMDLALKCTEELPELRISMKDVVTVLNKLKCHLVSSH